MRAIGLIDFLVTPTLMFVACSACAEEWQDYRPQNEPFTAAFPKLPHESTQTVDTAAGKITFHELSADAIRGRVSYSIIYNDYPDIVLKTPAEELLDGGRDGAVRDLDGKLLSEIGLVLDGHPGREYTIETQQNGHRFLIHTRVFLVDSRMYQLQVSRVDDTPLDFSEVIRFFGSFDPNSVERLPEAAELSITESTSDSLAE